MDKENWRDVEGYEGLYQVSDLGRVRSTRRQGAPGGLKTLAKNQDGYLRVKLCKDGKGRRAMVHRLVFVAFHGQMPEGTEINHIDENKANNRIDNLEAISHLENIRHGSGIARSAAAHRVRVMQYTQDGTFVAEYASREDATRATGVRGSGISLVAHGKQKQAGGFIWRIDRGEK